MVARTPPPYWLWAKVGWRGAYGVVAGKNPSPFSRGRLGGG